MPTRCPSWKRWAGSRYCPPTPPRPQASTASWPRRATARSGAHRSEVQQILARARIAAGLGRREQAVALLKEASARGMLELGSSHAFHADPLLRSPPGLSALRRLAHSGQLKVARRTPSRRAAVATARPPRRSRGGSTGTSLIHATRMGSVVADELQQRDGVPDVPEGLADHAPVAVHEVQHVEEIGGDLERAPVRQAEIASTVAPWSRAPRDRGSCLAEGAGHAGFEGKAPSE